MNDDPAKPGLSASGLEDARVYVAGCVERGEIAGAVMIASCRDEVAHLACIGRSDIDADIPMAPDTIFRIASMTKPMVSVGVLMLVEAGRLRLDDPVSRYVPEFAATMVLASGEHAGGLVGLERPITVHHLLTQTAGLAYLAPHPSLAGAYDDLGDSHYALSELVQRLAGHPLAHQPGEGWTYGWSYDVLGRVIEVVTDQPLDEYLADTIFGPLGMTDTGFRVPVDRLPRLAVVYESVEGRLRPLVNAETDRVRAPFPLLSGGSGCVSTAPDYLRFSRMLLRRGELYGVRLLRPSTVDEMTRNQLGPQAYPIRFGAHVVHGEGYGLGLGISVEPLRIAMAGSQGTYEWPGSWDTGFWVDPVKELIAIFMMQRSPAAYETGPRYWSRVCEALTG